VLVHNAAMKHSKPFADTDAAHWHEIFGANIDSAFYLAKQGSELMLPNNRGQLCSYRP